MTATSLHFGPEWMRNKQQTTPSTTRPPASVLSPLPQSTTPPAPPGASSYSSLLTPPAPAPPEKQDSVNPFKYSKEEMLQVWKDGGGRGALGLEVELWDGVVREIGGEPIGLKEMGEGERKLFSLPLNSDLRRRQSHDFLPTLTLATGERPKLPHSASSTHSPLSQQRFGALVGRRRKDDGTDGGPPLSVPRRLSLSSAALPLGGPLSPTGGALPSPRARLGSGTHGLDGTILTPGDGSWRKRELDHARAGGTIGGVEERDEEIEGDGNKGTSGNDPNGSLQDLDTSRSNSDRSMAPSPPSHRGEPGQQEPGGDLMGKLSGLTLLEEQRKSGNIPDNLGGNFDTRSASAAKGGISAARPPGLDEDPANVSWSYRDPKGNIQGPFTATLMQKWYDEGYFTPDLLMKRTHLDTDWTPVGELGLRAGTDKLFFSSFADPGPPGITPRSAAPPVDSQAFDRLGQPLGQTLAVQTQHQTSELLSNGSSFRNPIATRTPTLDSYLGTSSSNTSNSPASPFTAALGPLSSASPDLPFGVGGGVRSTFGSNGSEPAFGGRVGAFDSQPSSFGSRGGSTSFNATNDPPYGPRLASLGHRGAMFENQGFTNNVNPGTPTSPWSTGVNGNISRNSDTPGLGNLPIHRTSLNNGAFGHSPVTNVPGFNEIGGGHDSTVYGSDAYNYANAGFPPSGRVGQSADLMVSTFGPIGPGGGLREQGLRSMQDLDGMALNSRHGMDELPRAPGGFANGYGSSGSPIVHGQVSGFGNPGGQLGQQQPPPQHMQSSQHLPPISTFIQPSAVPAPSSPHSVVQPQQQSIANLPAPQSPWGVPEATAQPRPRPFDAPHPTSRNVVRTPITPNDTVSYNRPQSRPEASDWYTASKPELDDGWGDISATQTPPDQGNGANQGQQPGWIGPPRTSPPPLDHTPEQTSLAQAPRATPTPPVPQPPQPQPQPRESTSQPATKKRGSGPAEQPISRTPAAAPGGVISAPKPPSPLPTVSTQAKPAWSTSASGVEDDSKTTKQSGLREIQEAEAKRVEARKAAERERERATRAQPQEETQTFTASWGLPTSQAGAARSTPKENISASPSQIVTPPVWTNAGKPPQTKRTMKEIQEEEERRKKAAAKEKETAAAAARRAYADSANKTAPSPAAGGVWTTVGNSGRTNPTPSGPRQVSGTAQPTLSPQTSVRPSNGVPATRVASVSPQIMKTTPKQGPSHDGPVPPSPELMKWLREAVRGFNPGFNTEEFMEMLLTFSLDFPPSTVEIIQEMVYMNSATLDGRRFAADFCSRRKADAANRPKSWGTGASGKPPSLADVVKTQPKPAASEIPFKMVKKKGRGNTLR